MHHSYSLALALPLAMKLFDDPSLCTRWGDVVWLEFDPQAGHEQAGHRPALVLSPASYNAKTRLMGSIAACFQTKSNILTGGLGMPRKRDQSVLK